MMTSWLSKNKITGWTAAEAIDGGLLGVRVFPAENGGQPKVSALALAESDGPIDSSTLTSLARQLNGNGSGWVMTLPRGDYSLLVVPQPPVMATEIEASLRWSIANQIDFPVEEAAIAWMHIPTAEHLPNRAQHLYAAIARNNVVEHYEKIFNSANLPLEAVDVYETAQRNIARLVAEPGEGIGLLRIGKDGVEFTVTFDGELYLDRFIEEILSDGDAIDSEVNYAAIERIVLQVQRSLDFVERHLPFINIRRILLAPLPPDLPVEPLIAQNLSLPVQRLDLAKFFDISQTPELRNEGNQALYFTTLGAALRFLD